MKSDMVTMSKTKYMFYSIALIATGALIVGAPLFMQAKKYYDEGNQLRSKLDQTKTSLHNSESTESTLRANRNRMEDELNRVKMKSNNLLWGVTQINNGVVPNG